MHATRGDTLVLRVYFTDTMIDPTWSIRNGKLIDTNCWHTHITRDIIR